jgi:hypothetical protein
MQPENFDEDAVHTGPPEQLLSWELGFAETSHEQRGRRPRKLYKSSVARSASVVLGST